MAKQLNVNLAFTADTSQAKKQIQDLQTELTKLSSANLGQSKSLSITKELMEGQAAAKQLGVSLREATSQTGQLDFTKFSFSLSKYNTSLSEAGSKLVKLGSEGQETFYKISKAIADSSVQLQKSDGLLTKFAQTLKNTFQWQIASTMMHALQSSMSQAYNYAQDLNESLTNIRIVTGESTEQMVEFAKKANEAARALSTTTTAYTDAALIYYQQGLSDEAVQKRTETTIKMAQATGDSATQVSSYMTAVWNNFAEGSDNLEYFADVITALGAATASSSSEIAEGLEKFASIGETVGLSYEYATAALATITATTRASADVVGTSLKTIFSRLQGLNLGETLDDGTTLNKYSKALDAIGVNIKETDGSLKKMDKILDETAAKWKTLSRDQQMALAQTVAGVRQYTQFMTLMNNWDFMEENLSTAYNATGALEEQSSIYAEGWEAAQKKVRAALEELYSDLIDDKFFTNLFNNLAKVIGFIDTMVSSLGGLKGIIAGIGVLLSSTLGKSIQSSLNASLQNIFNRSSFGKKLAEGQKKNQMQESMNVLSNREDSWSKAQVVNLQSQLDIEDQLAKKQSILNNLSAEERDILLSKLEILRQNNEQKGKELTQISEKVDRSQDRLTDLGFSKEERENFNQIGKLRVNIKKTLGQKQVRSGTKVDNLINQVKNLSDMDAFADVEEEIKNLPTPRAKVERLSQIVESYFDTVLEDVENSLHLNGESRTTIAEINHAIKEAVNDIEDKEEANEEYEKSKKAVTENTQQVINEGKIGGERQTSTQEQQDIDALKNRSFRQKWKGLDSNDQELNDAQKDYLKTDITQGIDKFSKGLIDTSQGISQVSLGLSSIIGLIDTLNNKDLSFGEKLLATFTSLGTAIPSLIAGFPALTAGIQAMGDAITNSLSSAIIPFLSMAWPAVVAIGAIVAAFAAWEFVFSPEAKLKAANEELDKTKKSLEEATTKVNEFKSAYDDWNKLYEKTQTLVQGTQEYTDAINEANQAALDLINTYKLLPEDYEYDAVTGTYKIKDNSSVQKKLQDEKDKATLETNQATIKVNSEQSNKDIDSLRQYFNMNSNGTGYSNNDIKEIIQSINSGDISLEQARQEAEQKGMGGSSLDGYMSKLNELVISIDASNNQNDRLWAEVDIANKKANEEDKEYNEDVENLYRKYYERSGDDTEAGHKDETDYKGINEEYEKALNSLSGIEGLSSDDKKSLAVALADSNLGKSELDLSSVDTSNWSTQLVSALSQVFPAVGEALSQKAEDLGSKVAANYKTILSDIEDNNISSENYANLTDEAKTYFIAMSDGTYQLIGLADELKELLSQTTLQSFIDEQADTFSKYYDYDNLNSRYDLASENSDLYESAINKDKTVVQDQIAALNLMDSSAADKYQKKLDSGPMTEKDYANLAIELSKYREQLGDTETMESGFQQKLQDTSQKAIEQASTLAEVKQLRESQVLTEEQESTKLILLAQSYDNCTSELEAYQQALQTSSKSLQESKKAELELAIAAGEKAKKIDEDSDELEQLAKTIGKAANKDKEYSKDLKNNGKALAEQAKDLTRYDKAIKSVKTNWENWNKALKSNNLQDVAEAVSEIREAYGDLLDLDGEQLSEDFAQDEDNLKLLQEAIKGSETAYDKLLSKANEDMTSNIRLGLGNGRDVKEFDNSLSEVNTMMDQMGFAALKAGANLEEAFNDLPDPKLDNTSFLQSLTDMVNAAGLTADEATAYLSSMGIDAEVEQAEDTVTEEVATKVTPKSQGSIPLGVGLQQVSAAYGVDYDTEVVTAKRKIKGAGLKVTSANKSSGGKVKFNNSTNASGAGSKGSGGGGGKSFSPKKNDNSVKESDKKRYDDEIERYHEINKELEIQDKYLSKLNTVSSRAFGGNKVAAINDECDALKKENELLAERIKQTKTNLDQEKTVILSYGVKLDEDGDIANWTEVQKSFVDEYNNLLEEVAKKKDELDAAYNAAGDSSDEANEAYEKKQTEIEEWQKQQEQAIENKKTQIERYEEDRLQILEDQEQQQEYINELYDKELEKITTISELWDDIYDLRSDYYEFLEKQVGDDLETSLDRISLKFSQAYDLSEKFEQNVSSLDEVLNHMGIDYDDFMDQDDYDLPDTVTEDDINKLKDYKENLQEVYETLADMRDELLDELQEQFDGLNERIDDNINKLDVLKDWVSTYQNIIDIVGKRILDSNGSLSRKLSNTTYLQARENTKQLKSQLEYQEAAIKEYQTLLDELQRTNSDGANDLMIQNIKEQLKEAGEEYESTQSEWLSSWEETVQGATDLFSVEIENISNKLGDAISGMAGSLSTLQDQFDKANDINDEYVDDYEKIYQLSKLNRDISNSINDTDNIASKEALKELQEEINALQEDETKMSEYDLENLRRKYELRLALEQLQEAQNAKSQVRMTRDTEGNWGYVYTADSEAVSNAESNYEDKLYAMQQANTEYINTLQENIVNIETEYQEALAGIVPGDYESQAEYQEAVQQMQDYYLEKIRYFYDEMNKVTENNQELYNEDWAAYSEKTGYKISADEDYIDKFNETVLSQITGYETTQDAQDAFVAATEEATAAMNQAWDDWYQNTQEGLALGGTSIDTYTETVESDINDRIIPSTEALTEETDRMADEATEKFSEVSDAVSDFAYEWNSAMQEMAEYTNELTEALDELLQRFTEVKDSELDSDSSGDTNGWTWQQDSTGWWYGDGKGSYYKNGWKEIGGKWYYFGEDGYMATDTAKETINGKEYSWDLNKKSDGTYGSWTGSNPIDSSGNVATDYIIGSYTKATENWIKKLQNSITFDTGGYTGSWNSTDGKIAMLHSKELVLNADDTANILTAVDLIRSISSGIDLNAMSAAGGVLGNLTAGSVTSNEETLEQQVHITAEFPNVSDKNEILEAFDNVINLAAQYAQRN